MQDKGFCKVFLFSAKCPNSVSHWGNPLRKREGEHSKRCFADVNSDEVCPLPYQMFELGSLEEVELAMRVKSCQKLWNSSSGQFPSCSAKPKKVCSLCHQHPFP